MQHKVIANSESDIIWNRLKDRIQRGAVPPVREHICYRLDGKGTIERRCFK